MLVRDLTAGLGTTDLLTSAGRATVLARRDRALRLLTRDLVLGPHAWGRDAPEVEIDEPDELWAIVAERHRIDHLT